MLGDALFCYTEHGHFLGLIGNYCNWGRHAPSSSLSKFLFLSCFMVGWGAQTDIFIALQNQSVYTFWALHIHCSSIYHLITEWDYPSFLYKNNSVLYTVMLVNKAKNPALHTPAALWSAHFHPDNLIGTAEADCQINILNLKAHTNVVIMVESM